MANTIGRTQADTAGFIPIIWAQEALKVLRANIVLASFVARDTDFTPGFRGKTLNIPYPGTFTATAKTEGNPVTVTQTANAATIALSLTQHQYVDFIVEDWAAAQTNQNLQEQYIKPAAIALAEKLESDLFSLYSSFTVSTGVSGTDMTGANLRQAMKLLDDKKNPRSERMVVYSTKDNISILSDSSLQNYFAWAQAQAIAGGTLPTLYDFAPRMSQLVPAIGSAPVSTKNLALHKNAIILAVRPFDPIPGDSGAHSVTLNDDISGLSIRLTYQYDLNFRGVHVGLDILYGFAKLRDEAGVVILS